MHSLTCRTLVNRTLVRQFQFALFHDFVTHLSSVQHKHTIHLSHRPRKAAIYYYVCIRYLGARVGGGRGGDVLYYLCMHIKNKLITKNLLIIKMRVLNWGNNFEYPVS